MKIEIQSQKGLRTVLSIIVDKKTIQQKIEERLLELQKEVALKGFRPGKVPPAVIKSQFGKSVYGEVIDKILRESSSKAISEKKLKIAGQPKIDLKQFGEGKDLNYELQIDCLPSIELKPLNKFEANEYKIKIEKKIIEEKLNEISNQNKQFEEKKENEKASAGDQITFDYSATADGNKFDGSEGKGVQIVLGKDLFLKGFDDQLIGVKKGDTKSVDAVLPPNHPKKELANKKTIFECEIQNVKSPKKNKLDDEFAKKLGAESLSDLTQKIKDQISNQYLAALNSITKKEILEELEKSHKIEIPKNLIDNEVKNTSNNQNLKPDENTIKDAEKRIKLGLILNECGEKNNIKVFEQEIKDENQKQVKSMPGQEKFVFEYYQKNPSATQHLQSTLYEEKIIKFIKSKINLTKKELTIKEAEKMITIFNEKNKPKASSDVKKKETKQIKSKKISKK